MGRGGGMGGRRSGGRSSGRRSFGGRSGGSHRSGGRGGGFRSRGRTGRGGGFRSGRSHGGGGALGDTTYYVLQFVVFVFLLFTMTVLFSAVALVLYIIAANFIPSLDFWFEDYFEVVMIGCAVVGFVITVIVLIRFIFPRVVRPSFLNLFNKAKNEKKAKDEKAGTL